MITSDVKKILIIKTSSKEDELSIGTQIHEQLRGNQDYIDSNIVLSISQSFTKGTMPDNEVHLWISKDSSICPKIKINSIPNRDLTIEVIVNFEEEMLRIKDSIYKQLVGNKDYINSNIILNGSDDRQDENKNGHMVRISISSDTNPIEIFI